MVSSVPVIAKIDPTSNLTRYLQEIRKFPLLSREEEASAARNWVDDNNIQSAHKLVTHFQVQPDGPRC